MPTTALPFSEDFLHYLWQWRLFDGTNLMTTDGQTLRILHPGTHNAHDAGPDFSQARIRIGDTLWAGHVELHKRSSDWLAHGHDQDPAYQTVILHVVYENDVPIRRPSGAPIPTLVLRTRIASRHIQRYAQLLGSRQWIPCESQLSIREVRGCADWLEYLAKERLAYKAMEVEQLLEQTRHHWEESFYYSLARGFGLPQNAAAFESLARSLPLKVLIQNKHNLLDLEALLLGQSGLLQLETAPDAYTQQLQQSYQYLAHKYQLQPMPVAAWRRGGMRPAHFPTLRIAQFAALIHQSKHLLTTLLQTTDAKAMQQVLAVEASPYWSTHYRLGRITQARKKKLGKRTIQSLLINTVAPFLVAYGRYKATPVYGQNALALLRALPAEQNSMLEKWRDLGIKTANALDTQALLQLKKYYCTTRRCLECRFGHHVLNRRDFGRARNKKHLHVSRIE